VVVAVGLTLVEPLADVDVNVPGVMAIFVAPVVDQLSVLLEPEFIVAGLLTNELIVGGEFTVMVCVEVTEPAASVAFSVYVVVAVGLTLVEPLADVDVNVPGVMAILVAPLVDQLSVLLEPEFIVAGLPANELIVGGEFTVMVCVEVTEPAASVAFSVYVVVAVGLTLVEPLADVDVNVPGVMAILVAPFVDQLNVLLEPEFIVAGLLTNELIVGGEFTVMVCVEVTEPAASVAFSV